MYERLTKWEVDGCASVNGCSPIDKDMANAINRLCEIEDKICEGKILELPCEIGQTVYKVTYPYRAEPKVTEFIVCGFNYYRNAKRKMIMTLHLELKANRKLKHTAKLKDIYFTPEEANKKLKELEGE